MIYTKTDMEFHTRVYNLLNDNTSYDQFCRNLLNYPFLYVQFEAFLEQLTSEEVNDIEKRMRWFIEIIILKQTSLTNYGMDKNRILRPRWSQ
jgi:hypothetical protein